MLCQVNCSFKLKDVAACTGLFVPALKNLAFKKCVLVAGIWTTILTSPEVFSLQKERLAPAVEKAEEPQANFLCKIEIHDAAAEVFLDRSVGLEVLAEGFEIAEGPVWVNSRKMLLFSDVRGNKIHSWSVNNGSSVFLSPGEDCADGGDRDDFAFQYGVVGRLDEALTRCASCEAVTMDSMEECGSSG